VRVAAVAGKIKAPASSNFLAGAKVSASQASQADRETFAGE
jgi:hypothetical protein